jgi:hypothetical protein
MSRTENGKRHITSEDVATILATHGVPLDQREELIHRAKAANEPGWWDRALPGVPPEVGALASYEAEAASLTDWSPLIVPGLLQTYGYARAFMLDYGVDLGNIELRWAARSRRQQVLTTVEYTVLLGEHALRLPFGGGAVLAEQLDHLDRAFDRGIDIRIVPAVPHSNIIQDWLLMAFDNAPPVVHVELLRSAVYLHDGEVTPYIDELSRLRQLALSRAKAEI